MNSLFNLKVFNIFRPAYKSRHLVNIIELDRRVLNKMLLHIKEKRYKQQYTKF